MAASPQAPPLLSGDLSSGIQSHPPASRQVPASAPPPGPQRWAHLGPYCMAPRMFECSLTASFARPPALRLPGIRAFFTADSPSPARGVTADGQLVLPGQHGRWNARDFPTCYSVFHSTNHPCLRGEASIFLKGSMGGVTEGICSG